VNDYVNPANAITASRIVALVPYTYCVDIHDIQWAGLIVLYSAMADVVDGKVAKYFKCTSTFGEMFDAITDALCYGYMLALLVYVGWVPAIPAIGILVMGGLNTGMRAIYVRRAGRTTNYESFAMERVVAYVAFVVGMGTVHFVEDFLTWGCGILMAVVLLHDTKRMLIDPIPEPAPQT
jgi:phosphatidylglycerophosphate synthase